MTDAAVPVTQSAAENFTERYLRSLDCRVDKEGNKWRIKIPEDTETDLPKGDHILLCDSSGDTAETAKPLHPESSFFQAVLDDASDRAPIGRVTIDATDADVIVPDWLRESSVSVADLEFTPYYDRTALVVLFRVSIETVSEYQQELLRSIGIDVRSGEILLNIDRTLMDLTRPDHTTSLSSGTVELSQEQMELLIDTSREQLVSAVRPEIDEIHQEASRAADAELEEYRQLQQQREEELESELDRLRTRIEELSETIDGADQSERVESLKERREYKTKLEETEADLTDLRRRRKDGYPDRQREIRERHGVEVVITPVSATEVEYERGDVVFELDDDGTVTSLTLGYGSGVGVTEEQNCESCARSLSADAPLGSIIDRTLCTDCN